MEENSTMLPSNSKKNETNRPIFILGVPRSGTTLLSFILDSHPNIAIGRETLVMQSIHHFVGDWAKDRDVLVYKDWYLRYGVSRDQLTVYVRNFLNNFFDDYASQQGKKRWGDKTPRHTYYCNLIYEIFPNAQFIHIVRDPRAVCYSRKLWNDPVEGIAREWEEQNESVKLFGERVGEKQYRRITYEDLVQNPKPTIVELLSFLNEDWHDNLLRHHEVSPNKYIYQHDPKVSDGWHERVVEGKAVVEGGNDPKQAINTDSVEKWQKKLRKIEVLKIQEVTEKGMKDFGYKRAHGLIPLIGSIKLEKDRTKNQ